MRRYLFVSKLYSRNHTSCVKTDVLGRPLNYNLPNCDVLDVEPTEYEFLSLDRKIITNIIFDACKK